MAKSSKNIAENKSKPLLMFPDDVDTGTETVADTESAAEFEKAFTAGDALAGEIIHLGHNTDFSLIELNG